MNVATMLQPDKLLKQIIMASARIILYTHKKLGDESHPIVLQVIKDRRRKLISLGHSATLQQWDEEKNEPNKKHPNQKSLVLLMQRKIHQANKVILELDETGEPYSIEDVVLKLKTNRKDISPGKKNFTTNFFSFDCNIVSCEFRLFSFIHKVYIYYRTSSEFCSTLWRLYDCTCF